MKRLVVAAALCFAAVTAQAQVDPRFTKELTSNAPGSGDVLLPRYAGSFILAQTKPARAQRQRRRPGQEPPRRTGAAVTSGFYAVAFRLMPARRMSLIMRLRLSSRSMAAVASTTTATSKPACRASMADQATQ